MSSNRYEYSDQVNAIFKEIADMKLAERNALWSLDPENNPNKDHYPVLEEMYRKAWAEIERLGEETYKLRSDFIASYKVKEVDLPLLLSGCLVSGLIQACAYVGVNQGAIFRELGIEKPVYPYTAQIYQKIQESDLDQALRLIYLMFGDSAQLLTAAGSKGDLPYYYPSKRMEILYDFLRGLGYKISDEEKALRDGSHEAYGGRKKLIN